MSLHKCVKCGKYSFSQVCSCGGKALNSQPAKYSPHDAHAALKRQAKQEEGYFEKLKKRFKK